MKKTPLIVTGAVAALVLGGGSSAMAMTHEVDMNVHGKHTTVRMLSGTVRDALEGQGVKLASTDKVTPSLDEPIDEATSISVVAQHPVTITVDGKTTKKLTTAGTVAGALKGFEIPAGASITPSPKTKLGAKNTAIVVTTTKNVTFTGQNGEATMAVGEGTIGEAAAAHLTDIQPSDKYYDTANTPLDPATPVTEGMVVRVERVRESDATATQDVDYKTVTKEDDSQPEGSSTVTTKGVKGSKDVITHTVTVDGKVTSQTVTSENVTKAPVDEVVTKGTKKAEKTPEPTKAAETAAPQQKTSQDSAPASAPSSPAPSASSSKSSTDQGGTPSGDSTTCTASYYGDGDGTDGSATASGETFDSSAMTAAHKTLPLGTRIKVTNTANGQSVTVRVNDRGPYVSGRCLDLSAAAFKSIGSTGSGTMTVSFQTVG